MTNQNQQIVAGFVRAVMAAQKNIPYNPQFMDHVLRVERNVINFMNIVDHPKLRIVLENGETALVRSTHPNPKFASATNIILLRGTPYGTIAMFGLESEYAKDGGGKFTGPVPTLHAGRAFRTMAMRFFERSKKPFALKSADELMLAWIFSDTFDADLAKQVEADTKKGIEIGDGLPPKAAPQKQQTKKKAKAKAPEANKAAPQQPKQEKKKQEQKPTTESKPVAAPEVKEVPTAAVQEEAAVSVPEPAVLSEVQALAETPAREAAAA